MRRNISISEATDKKIRELGGGKKGDFSGTITRAIEKLYEIERCSSITTK